MGGRDAQDPLMWGGPQIPEPPPKSHTQGPQEL